MEAEDIEKRQIERRTFLDEVYKRTSGTRLKGVNLVELGEELGFNQELTKSLIFYLSGEGLIENLTHDGSARISHEGINEVESYISKDSEIVSSPNVNVINIENMTSSQIQQGTNGSYQSYVDQKTFAPKLEDVLVFVKTELESLPLDAHVKEEIFADIGTTEVQLKSPRPKKAIVKACFESMKTILENAVTNVATSKLTSLIDDGLNLLT